MKKYKEWLKDRLESLRETDMRMRKLYEPNSVEHRHFNGRLAAIDEVLDLIDKLDESEVLSQEWIEEHRKSYTMEDSVEISDLQNLLVPKQEKVARAYKDGYEKGREHGFYKGYREGLANKGSESETLSQEDNINIVLDDLKEHIKEQQSLSQNVGMAHTPAGNDTHYRQYDYVLECINEYEPSDDLQNLIISKQELPVIPKYVAKYLEFAKKEASLIQVMITVSEGWPTMKKEFDWISENNETFARAWLDGYEVEEQKYVVPIDENHALCKFTNVVWGIYKENTDKLYLEDYFKFTEQEIKEYDERYFAFAVPVEETELF